MKKFARLSGVAAVALVASANAQAALLQFDLTGDATASFVLDQSPIVDTDFGSEFRIENVSGLFNGSAATFAVYFFEAGAGGSLALVGVLPQDLSLAGDQLFSGGIGARSLLTGSFSPVDYYTGGGDFTLTITSLSAAVPEPASWALIVSGFGLLGGVMRRQRLQIQFG